MKADIESVFYPFGIFRPFEIWNERDKMAVVGMSKNSAGSIINRYK